MLHSKLSTAVIDGQVVLTAVDAKGRVGTTVLTEGIGEHHGVKRSYAFEVDGQAFIDVVTDPKLSADYADELEYHISHMHWDSVQQPNS